MHALAAVAEISQYIQIAHRHPYTLAPACLRGTVG